MAVLEELQVLADDEGVKEPFVDEIERRDGPILPRVVDGELQDSRRSPARAPAE